MESDPPLADASLARQVLDGIRVLDFSSGPAGGLATTVLADFGADVVKVEPSSGDRFRMLPGSPLWLRGKRSVVLDLKDAEGRSRAQGLADSADVVLISGPVGVRRSSDSTSRRCARAIRVWCTRRLRPGARRAPTSTSLGTKRWSQPRRVEWQALTFCWVGARSSAPCRSPPMWRARLLCRVFSPLYIAVNPRAKGSAWRRACFRG